MMFASSPREVTLAVVLSGACLLLLAAGEMLTVSEMPAKTAGKERGLEDIGSDMVSELIRLGPDMLLELVLLGGLGSLIYSLCSTKPPVPGAAKTVDSPRDEVDAVPKVQESEPLLGKQEQQASDIHNETTASESEEAAIEHPEAPTPVDSEVEAEMELPLPVQQPSASPESEPVAAAPADVPSSPVQQPVPSPQPAPELPASPVQQPASPPPAPVGMGSSTARKGAWMAPWKKACLNWRAEMLRFRHAVLEEEMLEGLEADTLMAAPLCALTPTTSEDEKAAACCDSEVQPVSELEDNGAPAFEDFRLMALKWRHAVAAEREAVQEVANSEAQEKDVLPEPADSKPVDEEKLPPAAPADEDSAEPVQEAVAEASLPEPAAQSVETEEATAQAEPTQEVSKAKEEEAGAEADVEGETQKEPEGKTSKSAKRRQKKLLEEAAAKAKEEAAMSKKKQLKELKQKRNEAMEQLRQLQSDKLKMNRELALQELKRYSSCASDAIERLSNGEGGFEKSVAEGFSKKLADHKRDAENLHQAIVEISDEEFPLVEQSFAQVSKHWKVTLATVWKKFEAAKK